MFVVPTGRYMPGRHPAVSLPHSLRSRSYNGLTVNGEVSIAASACQGRRRGGDERRLSVWHSPSSTRLTHPVSSLGLPGEEDDEGAEEYGRDGEEHSELYRRGEGED